MYGQDSIEIARDLPPVDAHPLDWELLVCTHVLGLTSLHWGLWTTDSPLTLDSLREAQERYTELILNTVPAGVRSAIDVGCGTGDLARRLAARGCRVKAIAPIANYEHRLSLDQVPGLSWQRLRLQDLNGDGRYDAVLMIESAGYFPIALGLEQARNHLRSGGWLLVVNPFRTVETEFEVARHGLSDYLDAAREYGFVLDREIDITDAVLPTLHLTRRFRTEHAEPALSLLRFAAMRSRPVRLGLGLASFFFRRRLEAVRRKLKTFREQMDPDLFREHARYMVLLFRLGG